MKSLFRPKRDILFSERGAAFILFALSVPVLLGLTCMAVDIGALYLARDRANALARSGAASMLNMRTLKGWAPLVRASAGPLGYTCTNATGTPTELIATLGEADILMRSMIQTMYGESPDNPGLRLEYSADNGTTWSDSTGSTTSAALPLTTLNLNNANERVILKVRFAPKTLLVSKLTSLFGSSACTGPSSDRCWIESEKEEAGRLRPADIYLLLDYSGSMASTLNGSTDTKEVALEKAVGTFIDFFNPLRDNIAVIPYSTGVRRSSKRLLGSFEGCRGTELEIKKSIEDLVPSGQTNPCDALVTAIQDMPAPTPGSNPRFVVLFTDGAPNVYRLGFCDDTNCPNKSPGLPGGTLTNDWYGWEVLWGKRKVYAPPSPVPAAPCSATSASLYWNDPFFGVPLIDNGSGTNPPVSFPAVNGVRGSITLDENGVHRFNGNPLSSYTPPYALQFASESNYKWSGPSYLVHASYDLSQQVSLIDRLIGLSAATATTCGPPSGPANGAQGERYHFNHSRYFASRVLNSNWGLDTTVLGSTLRNLTGLVNIFPTANQPANICSQPRALNNAWSSASPVSLQMRELPTTAPGCLNSMNAFIPGTTANIFVGSGFISNETSSSITAVGEIVKSAELPYYCAVRAADYLRTQNVIVFVVGLGDAASDVYATSCNDPMENALDASSRKDNFLKRLAFAPESLANAANFIGGTGSAWHQGSDFRYRKGSITAQTINCTNHPLNGQQVNIGYGETWSGGAPVGNSPAVFQPRQLGAYYPSNNPDQLGGIFGKIAKQILLRLSQ